MQIETFAEISGLFFYPNYFSQDECSSLIGEALVLYDRLEEKLNAEEKLESVDIPQPEFVRSAQHNLESEEHFARIRLLESAHREIRCEYFPRYGEDGHALGYFRGNNNIPDFVHDSLIRRIHSTIIHHSFVTKEQEVTWKLTANYYKTIQGRVAGFPFHVDIPANGVVTMITNIHQEALFQIAKDDLVKDIHLPIGSLLLLSGESRYEWKHRVLPKEDKNSHENEIKRISLVLGFQ